MALIFILKSDKSLYWHVLWSFYQFYDRFFRFLLCFFPFPFPSNITYYIVYSIYINDTSISKRFKL